MAETVLGIVLLIASGVFGVLLSQLDKLLAPIDSEAPKADTLDAMEVQIIEWFLVPLAKRVAGAQDILPTRDIDMIRAGYHYNIAALERARVCVNDFGDARSGLFRSLVGCAVVLVPAGVLAAILSADPWVPVAVAMLLALFVGFVFTSGSSLSRMRKARKQYASIAVALKDRLAAQSLIMLRQHSPGGDGHA